MRKKKVSDREFLSAQYLVGVLLNSDAGKYEINHMRELLSTLIWKITEANGKYNLRFISEAALKENSKKYLIHEHVYKRGKLVSELLDNPEKYETILSNTIACLVTKTDHEKLSKIDEKLNGWDRYMAAGIKVYDNFLKKIIT